jgi:hypothetical protein
MLVLLAALSAQAACPVTFAFQGQPDCISLDFQTDRIQLVNACTAPVLVDQSVVLRSDSQLIPAGSSAWIRDLSAFTVGMEGRIYPVLAYLVTCEDTPAL